MTHYDTLGVAPAASAGEIRDAYRRLARRHHPDSAEQRDATAMARINDAYRVLGDPGRRAAYDAQLRSGRPAVTVTRAAPPAEPTVSPSPPPPLPPARFPWKLAGVMFAIGAIVVLIGAALYEPGTDPPPDNVLQPGSCVVVEQNRDVREVNCTGSADELVVASLVAVDEVCPDGLSAYRDRQGLGMACVRTSS
jgi:molecular chaperone DnaJ